MQATILNMTASFITRAEVNAQFSTVAALNATAAALNVEISARQAGVGGLTSNLNSEIFRATAAEGNLTANFATITANLGTLSTNLASAVATLTANLNIEITARIALGTGLTTEISRASAAESILTANMATITANLNTEIATRTSLSTNLQNEISRATVAEGNLTTNLAIIAVNLNNEIATRTNNEATLTTNLAVEVTNRVAAITTETNRATVAESVVFSVAMNAYSLVNTTVTALSSTTSISSSANSVTSVEYWIDSKISDTELLTFTYIPANTGGNVIVKILGVGFQLYFNPQFQIAFICNFSNPDFGVYATYGVVLSESIGNASTNLFYHLECPVPIIFKALFVTISVGKANGQLFPFAGFPGGNILTVQYCWTSAGLSGRNVSVMGVGFNILATFKNNYLCIFTGRNATNTMVVSFLGPATNSTTLNCGPTPSGFTVSNTSMLVNLTIFEGNMTGYQVLSANNVTLVNLNACFDQVMDGDETGLNHSLAYLYPPTLPHLYFVLSFLLAVYLVLL